MFRLYIRRTELAGFVARKEDDASCLLRIAFKHTLPSVREQVYFFWCSRRKQAFTLTIVCLGLGVAMPLPTLKSINHLTIGLRAMPVIGDRFFQFFYLEPTKFYMPLLLLSVFYVPAAILLMCVIGSVGSFGLVLRRDYGLRRCRYHGEAGMGRWIGWGIVAHNLARIASVGASR